MVEKVQHRCTKFGPLANLSYHDRLVQLGLTTLEVRRKRGDLIQMYKYVKCIDRIQFVNPPVFRNNINRSHGLQFEGDGVFKLHQARKNYFLNRANKDWNELPLEVLGATNFDNFKKKLDRLKQFQLDV
jgi:hypothetical protein